MSQHRKRLGEEEFGYDIVRPKTFGSGPMVRISSIAPHRAAFLASDVPSNRSKAKHFSGLQNAIVAIRILENNCAQSLGRVLDGRGCKSVCPARCQLGKYIFAYSCTCPSLQVLVCSLAQMRTWERRDLNTCPNAELRHNGARSLI